MSHDDILSRLADAGYTLPGVLAPIAAYAPAAQTGSLIFTSGQLPIANGGLLATGKVGEGPDLVTPAAARDLAALCALNALAAVAAKTGDLGKVAQVVKLVGFVASDPTFTGQSAVMDGASDLLILALGELGVHARSAVGVAVLPRDSPVEVELVVALR